jgi:hypothetical protein
MPKPALDRPGVVALVGERIAAVMAQYVPVRLHLQSRAGRRRSIIRAKPGVVNGEPRSLTKMKVLR